MALAPSLTPDLKLSPIPLPSAQPSSDLPLADPLAFDQLLPKPPRFYFHGIPIDRIPLDYAAAWVIHALNTRGVRPPLLIMGPNAQLITLATRNPRFAAALCSANLSVPDGVSVVLASRLLQQPIPERVTGGDLMERLCIEAASNHLSVFFLGGLPGAGELAARKFERSYFGFRTAGVCCPPLGFENDPMECARIRGQIAEAKPDLLCVALGAPKQEIWMYENCPTLPIGAAISVGAAFDTQAGIRRRAPRWTHRIGCEWLYRLVREPRRLWRRYLIGNTQFILLAGRQWWRESLTGRRNVEPLASQSIRQ